MPEHILLNDTNTTVLSGRRSLEGTAELLKNSTFGSDAWFEKNNQLGQQYQRQLVDLSSCEEGGGGAPHRHIIRSSCEVLAKQVTPLNLGLIHSEICGWTMWPGHFFGSRFKVRAGQQITRLVWNISICHFCLVNKNCTTMEHPGQLLPFSQSLLLEWTPPPHSALQWAQGPHGVHITGTGQGFFSLHSLETK